MPYDPQREWFTLEVRTGTEVKPPEEGKEQTFYLTFVVFPAGQYVIGSPPKEPDRATDETQHHCRITRPIAILDREITRAEAEASGLSIKGNERTCPTPDHPMGGINWYDAVAFCRWLGQQAGFSEDEQAYPDPATLDARQYPADPSPAANGAPLNWPLRLDRGGFRLPTEQEWEIACRRDTGSSYGYGRDSALLDRYAWFTESSKGGGRLPRELRPNLRGLFDMHGNVWEWCHDWYGEYASSDAVDPIRTAGGSYRVYRGGSWSSASRLCRSADRYGDAPANRTGDVGFRVAQVPSGKPEVSGAGSGSR